MGKVSEATVAALTAFGPLVPRDASLDFVELLVAIGDDGRDEVRAFSAG